jgi:aminodeoxyfutalosine deaminase
MTSASHFIAGMPKVELHVHLVGSASVDTVLDLARKHPDLGVPTNRSDLKRFYQFRDFARFIDVYMAVNELVRTADDVQALTFGVAGELAAQQVRYAELTVTPDAHLLVGIEPDGLAAALDSARNQARDLLGIELAWIFDIPGELGLASGERTIAWVEKFAPPGSVGFGLGGPEVGVSRAQFAEAFARARALGLASVPHAGETTGPETIWESIRSLGAQRIGHGIAAARDPELMTYLVDRDIALEVCPTSNVCTRAVRDLASHPLPALIRAGVTVTLNSDDPGMFSTSLNQEYVLAHESFGLTLDQLVDLARAAVRVSYCPDDLRRRLIAEIDAYAGSRGSPRSKM